MPQRSLSVGITASPIEDATVQLSYRFYDEFFADWSPTSREYGEGDTPDRKSSWQIPHYSVVDLNASYDIPFEFRGAKPQLVVNIRNLFDTVYIQDATDNSRYNAYPFRVNSHTANSAEVYMGMPTTFNIGLKVRF